MSGLHLFIFCHHSYRHAFLDACVLSIETNIKDKIASYNIITDRKFKYRNYNVIEDNEIWDQFDPKFEYQFLYKNNWLKQQILKLACDKIKSNNLLIIDCDVFFIKPVKLIVKNKFNFYMANEYHRSYFNTNQYLLNLDKQTEKSFISDFIIFNSNILKSLKTDIEQKNNDYWVLTLENYLSNSSNFKTLNNMEFPLFSEYELYGSYVYKNYKPLINSLISPIDYKMWIFLELDKIAKEPKKFLSFVKSKSKNYYQSVKKV
jgi:hypothetical protein